MSFKTSAVPKIVTSAGALDSTDNKNAIRGLSEPSGVSLQSIIATVMSIATDALRIIIAPFYESEAGKPGTIFATNMAIDLSATTSAKIQKLKPVAGQSGKSLQFELDGAATSGFNAGLLAAITEEIAAVIPRFSAGSLATRILANCPDLPNGVYVAVGIDQVTGKITVMTYTDTASFDANVNTNALDGSLYVVVQHEMPLVVAPSAPDTSLPFEGGSF